MFSMKWPEREGSAFLVKLNNTVGPHKQDKVIGSLARQVRDIAKTLAPHGTTGNLARSIYSQPISNGVWEVGSPMVYAWAVEFGSGVFGEGPTATGKPIEPVESEYLVFKIGGEWKRVRFVLGQHPQPYIRPAVEQADTKKSFGEMFK
jgi:hypothetical protein